MARNLNPILLPADMIGQPNGAIPRELMVLCGKNSLYGSGVFLAHRLFARAWNALSAAVLDNTGVDVRFTGVYRTYERQVSMFLERYRDTGTSSLTLAKVRSGGKAVKFWSAARPPGTGTYWYKLDGYATAATPGTSNHGIALATDLHTADIPAGGAVIRFLEAHAQAYGFSWESGIQNSEPWHIRYFAGDDVPQAVLIYEAGQQPPPPPQPDPVPPPNLPAGMEQWMKDYLVWFCRTDAYPPASMPTIRNPQKVPKEIIQYAQICLRFVWNQDIVIDGDYGPRSEGACRNMQAWVRATSNPNMDVDGVIGPAESWPVLQWTANVYKNEHGW